MNYLLRKDVAAGLMFIAIGLAFAYIASSYRMGVIGAMGAGYFPFWLGIILATLGAIVFVGGLLRADAGEDLHGGWNLYALALVTGSILLFGVLLVPAGLIGTIFILVIVSSLASREFTWTTAISNAAVLVALCLAVFIWGLGLQLPILPRFLAY